MTSRPEPKPVSGGVVERGSAESPAEEQGWLTAGVAGIGTASLLADLGHEVPNRPVTKPVGQHAAGARLGAGRDRGGRGRASGIARLAGGALSDDPARRRSIAVGGYATTAVLSGLIGVAGAVWQVGVLRTGAWAARGLRVPARNALLDDVVPAAVYGRAYGFECAMDNLPQRLLQREERLEHQHVNTAVHQRPRLLNVGRFAQLAGERPVWFYELPRGPDAPADEPLVAHDLPGGRCSLRTLACLTD